MTLAPCYGGNKRSRPAQTPQDLTAILTRTGYQYQTTWVNGVLISHKCEVQVHIHRHLGIEGRLAAYELLGPTWQLNIINVHVPFDDTTDTFLEPLMEAYRQLAVMGPAVIIGDFNAAPAMDDHGKRPTSEDTAVKMAMQHLDLQDITASLQSQSSHRPPQLGSTDSRIDLCYADPTHVEVTRTQYEDLPSKATGHRPLEVQLKVLQVPPTPLDDVDQDAQPPISPPEEHNTPKWMAYYHTVDPIRGRKINPDLNLAMKQAATACGLRGGVHHEQETATPHWDLRSMVNAVWCYTRDLHTAIHSQDTHSLRHAHRIAARLGTTRWHLREWHERGAKDLAQERQRYLQIPKPYKSPKHVDKILGETGNRGIRAVRLEDGTVTNDPRVAVREVLHSFKREHNAEDGELSDYTKNLISHLAKTIQPDATRRHTAHPVHHAGTG